MTESSTSDTSALIKCTVISCPNYFHTDMETSEDDVRFFQFPKDPLVASTWKEKCGVSAHHDTRDAHVCSNHFKLDDFTNELKCELREDAIPRQQLEWMLGMPEVKINTNPVKLEQVKEAVDTNERLIKRLEELVEEEKQLKERMELYRKKNENVDNEIVRLTTLISKFPHKRRNGNVTDDLISKVFSPAQINMLMGKRKVVWSYNDMAMAFTLRHIGNRECYLYLKNVLNMPLPALSAVQRWVASNK